MMLGVSLCSVARTDANKRQIFPALLITLDLLQDGCFLQCDTMWFGGWLDTVPVFR